MWFLKSYGLTRLISAMKQTRCVRGGNGYGNGFKANIDVLTTAPCSTIHHTNQCCTSHTAVTASTCSPCASHVHLGTRCLWPSLLLLYLHVAVVVVNVLFQIKKDTLVIGHCTALAVIATKTLAGKKLNWKKTKMKSLLHLMCWCDKQRGASTPGLTTD